MPWHIVSETFSPITELSLVHPVVPCTTECLHNSFHAFDLISAYLSARGCKHALAVVGPKAFPADCTSRLLIDVATPLGIC